MTEKKSDEPTPTYQSFPFTEAELEIINLYAMTKNCLLRDWYAEAYAREVERRRKWTPKNDLDLYIWMAYPSDHPDTERRTVVTHEEHVSELEKWAARDGVKKVHSSVSTHPSLSRRTEKYAPTF